MPISILGLPVPTPKEALRVPVNAVRVVEGVLPAGVPSIAGILSGVTEAVPDMPAPQALMSVLGVRAGARTATYRQAGRPVRIMGGGYRSF